MSEHAAFDFGLSLDGEHIANIQCRACFQPWPCLTEQLATERQRAERAEAELANSKWELLGLSEQKHDAYYALDRAERERDGYRAALAMAERNSRSNRRSVDWWCVICDQVTDREGGVIDHAPDCPFAALAGTPEDQPLLTPSESHPAAIRVTEVRRGEPAIYPDETLAPACTEAHHVVTAGSDACQCGKHRMERML